MSAAANAAGYLYMSGMLKRRKERRDQGLPRVFAEAYEKALEQRAQQDARVTVVTYKRSKI